MAKFRKKPVVIEAYRVPLRPEDRDGWKALMKFLPSSAYSYGNNLAGYIDITTLEGTMRANSGDWIIRGVKNEFYPCKPDIFEATYEPVE